jgi:hypothetical protein
MAQIAVLVVLILLMTSRFTLAEDSGAGTTEQPALNPWHLTLYAGIQAQDSLRDVYTLQAKFVDDTYMVDLALARDFYQYKDWLKFEVEGQVAKHFGEKDDQWEFVGLVILRWLAFPWDKTVDTSLALGEGLSYYTKVSEIELEESPDAQKLLNYLLIEITLGLPEVPKWDLSLRIHHRSGIWGLVGESGSNILCAGVRYSF